MVENQHGLGSVLSFSAKSVNPKILEALLIGRNKIVDQLENRVKNIAKDGLNHQVLIVGARGTGKTHMLSVLHHRIQPFIEKKKIKVAYFAEEEYGISGFLDFMVRILNAFIRWNEEDAEHLRSQLSMLQETPSSYQEETIKKIIQEYVGDRPLLVLAENFNDILDAIDKEGQSKLRNWLQQNDRISIVATSQALSDDIGKEDKPFYGFFDEINLKPLSLEQSYQLLKSLARIENKNKVLEHLENKGKAQVAAINSLVKGNHRLLITFYEFLKSDVLSNLSVMFIKTLNDLKPYYETYIRYLPPQQQKILRFIALSKIPQKGTDIARECFIEQKSLSKQLSELSRKKLVEIIVDPDDKRNKLYDIAEPLLRISIEIGEQKEGISALFIDFLALYYDQNELNNQKDRFSKIYKDCADPKEKQQYSFEISAREKALRIQTLNESKKENSNSLIFDEVIKKMKNIEYDEALSILNTKSLIKDESVYFLKAVIHAIKKEYKEAKKQIKKAIRLDSKSDSNWFILGDVLYNLKEYDESLNAYNKSHEIDPNDEQSLLGMIRVFETTSQIDSLNTTLKKVLKINPKNIEALSKLANNSFDSEEYEKAIIYYKKLIKLNKKNYSYYLMAGICYGYMEEMIKSFSFIEKAFKLESNNIDILKVFSALNIRQKKYGKGVELIYKMLKIDSKKISNEDLSWAINLILKYDKNINLDKLLEIEETYKSRNESSNEIQISLQLLKTFKKVVLENDEKALYQLPKEQRSFFQKEILDFRKVLE
jgi:tetratricopeptide (TPR) repeat protein